MKIKQFGLILTIAFFLLYFPAMSYAQQVQGDREFILSGTGASNSGFDTTTFGLVGQIGQFYTRDLEFGIRQGVGFSDTGDTSRLNGSTRAFADFHFDMDRVQPFIGASMGGQYGSGVNKSFIIGPEAGLKYYVREKTFIVGQAAYLFDVDENVDDGSFFYNVGIGFNF